MKPRTFEDWWEQNGYDYVTTKQLARDAWFSGQEQVNKALSWWKLEGDVLPKGAPADPGTTLYAFDENGTWVFYLPPLS